MSSILLGAPLVESAALNAAIVIVELIAVAGFYGSPFIIHRFSSGKAPLSPAEASKKNLLYTLSYLVILTALILFFKAGIILYLGVAVWFVFNRNVLCYGYADDDGNEHKGFPVTIIDKYSEIVIYIIVGVLTTVVAWATFYLLSLVLDSSDAFQLAVNNTLSWLVGVCVAYPMNRCWVFQSTNPEKFKEFIGFAASRVSTWLIELVLMALLVNVIGLNQFVSKYVICAILVIVLNYVFSKLLVFKKKAR